MNDSPLVVFDMDGVLIHNRSSWRIIHEAVGTSNEYSFQAYMKGEIDDLEFMRRDIDLWKKNGILLISQVEEILRPAVNMKGLIECMADLKDAGVDLAIISGGIDILADRMGNILNTSTVHANGIAYNEDRELTGEGILRVPLRDKGSVLRSIVDNDRRAGPVIAVGDSPVDITMFKEADLSIAFNPDSDLVSESADIVILEKDLKEVSRAILKWLKER